MVSTLRNTLGPLLLILLCPPCVMLMWYTNTALQGSFSDLFALMFQQGVFQTLYQVWRPVFWGSNLAWGMLFSFIVFQFLLMKWLPGKTYQGPVTPKGNVPLYKDNGSSAFFITLGGFCLASFGLKLFPASILYDHLGSLFGALNLFSLLVCLFLYLKGRFMPSSTDAGLSHHFLFDYYWGTELYPQFFGLSIKKFIACRLGMMSWGLFLISYAAKQADMGELANSMMVSVGLQLIYITKFFIWEPGYLRSLDMMHDRAGFYICWGCLVWVPCVYTSPSMYLVNHPIHLNELLAAFIFILGTGSILINYLADQQRLKTRSTNGACLVWGKKPTTLRARYQTEEGQAKETLLLVSGWWGVSRHFHYVPEVMAAFLWSVPALFNHFSPYFYVTFLGVLLLDRAFRDDKRCAKKYGKDWQTYCAAVPYKIIPFLI